MIQTPCPSHGHGNNIIIFFVLCPAICFPVAYCPTSNPPLSRETLKTTIYESHMRSNETLNITYSVYSFRPLDQSVSVFFPRFFLLARPTSTFHVSGFPLQIFPQPTSTRCFTDRWQRADGLNILILGDTQIIKL